MRREEILNRAEVTIKEYKIDESKSKYYKELKKSLNEYETMQIHNKKIDKLYLKHMEDLCDYLTEKRHYKSSIAITLIMIIFTIFCVVYSSLGFNNINRSVIPNIIAKEPNIKLDVSYKDVNNLMLRSLPSSGLEDELEPATINIKPSGDKGDIVYNIYIIPIEYGKDLSNLNDYVFKVDDTKVVLNENKLINNRIKIYSGKMNSEENKIHKIRLWINNDFNKIYKDFSFKIYVEGYIV